MPDPVDTICPDPCGATFQATMPEIDANNTRNYSTAIAVHQDTIQCPACGRHLVPVFAQLSVIWGLRPVASKESQEPSRILYAPSATNRNPGD